MDKIRNGKKDEVMKELEDDKWLKDLFSEQPETNLSTGFEASLMQRIEGIEAKTQQKKQHLIIFLSVFGSVALTVGVIVLFFVFGWAESIASSMSRVFHQFSALRFNLLTLVPVLTILLLLFVDLFARRALSKEN